MIETRAEIIRRAAALMREQHGPDHVRHGFWHALAGWLEASAESAERAEAEGGFVHPDSHAFKVACAYLGEPA